MDLSVSPEEQGDDATGQSGDSHLDLAVKEGSIEQRLWSSALSESRPRLTMDESREIFQRLDDNYDLVLDVWTIRNKIVAIVQPALRASASKSLQDIESITGLHPLIVAFWYTVMLEVNFKIDARNFPPS